MGTARLEAREYPEPVVDPARAEQRVAQRLVREDMARIAGEDLLERCNGSVGAALFLEDHPDVEIRGNEVGRKGKRALICAQCFIAKVQGLQRHAVVVVGLAVGRRERERLLECNASGGGIVASKLGQAQRAQQRQRGGASQSEPLAA